MLFSTPRPDDLTTDWARIHSMWIALGLLFLLWQLHALISTTLRANTIANIRKRGILLPEQTQEARIEGRAVDWILRIRHAGRLCRDSFLLVLFLVLIVHLWVVRPFSLTYPPGGVPPGGDLPGPGNLLFVDEGYLFTIYAFTWVIASMAFFQVFIHVLVESLLGVNSTTGRGYEYFGPGVYGRRESQFAWVDALFEVVKFVSLTIIVIVGLTTETTYKSH